MKKRRIVVSVISDLVSDQRVHRVCNFLHDNNCNVILIGRKVNYSIPLEKRHYRTIRIYCYFSKGILQYAEFNLKLFFFLFFLKADIFLSNDLDTLTPNFIHAKLRCKKLVYDSHEYFTGVPELQTKPLKLKFWKWLEKTMLPKLKYAYTVNKSIANLYKAETGVNMKVVRNLPYLRDDRAKSLTKFFPNDKIILLLQGAGINRDRGGEELVRSMLLLPSKFMLVIIGSGDVWEELKSLHIHLKLQDRIRFIEKVPMNLLPSYTEQAHLGFSLDKPVCLNYQLSLPNKVFDYIHAGVPVISSNVTEVKKILEMYKVGTTVNEVTAEDIAFTILDTFEKTDLYERWKANTLHAAKELCWQKEQKILEEIFEVG